MFSSSENALSSMRWQKRHQNAVRKSIRGLSCSRALRKASSSHSCQRMRFARFGFGEKRIISVNVFGTRPSSVSIIIHVAEEATNQRPVLECSVRKLAPSIDIVAQAFVAAGLKPPPIATRLPRVDKTRWPALRILWALRGEKNAINSRISPRHGNPFRNSDAIRRDGARRRSGKAAPSSPGRRNNRSREFRNRPSRGELPCRADLRHCPTAGERAWIKSRFPGHFGSANHRWRGDHARIGGGRSFSLGRK